MDYRSELQITTSKVEAKVPLTVFELGGRINLSNSAELERVAQQHIDQGMRYLLLDLGGVPSITSAGLRAIQLIYRLLEDSQPGDVGVEAQVKSRHLKLFTPSQQVRTVLGTAGFDLYIDTYADRQAAIEAFQ